MMQRLYGCAALAIALGAAPSAASAESFTLDAAGNCVTIGMAAWGGVMGSRATMCWRDNGSNENLVELRTDASAGGLNQNVVIYAAGGADSMRLVPYDNYTAATQCDCGLGAAAWDKLVYNGYYLDLFGQDGNDSLEGAVDSGDTYVHGDGGADYCYNYSSVGRLYGEAGNDQLVSSTTGGSDSLYGGADNDCLWDTSGTYTACDCGTGGSDLRHTSHACSNCEGTASCCGVC